MYTVLQCDLAPHCGEAPRAEIRTRDGRSRGSDSDHYRPPHLPCSNHSGLTHSVRSLFAVCKIIYSLLSMVCMGLRHNLCDGKNPSHHRQYICTLYTVYCIYSVYALLYTISALVKKVLFTPGYLYAVRIAL